MLLPRGWVLSAELEGLPLRDRGTGTSLLVSKDCVSSRSHTAHQQPAWGLMFCFILLKNSLTQDIFY